MLFLHSSTVSKNFLGIFTFIDKLKKKAPTSRPCSALDWKNKQLLRMEQYWSNKLEVNFELEVAVGGM